MTSNYLPLTLHGQHIKDLSFENPNSHKLPKLKEALKIELDVKSEYLDLKKDMHELNLKIKVNASIEDKILFILELQYAGFFECKIKDDSEKKSGLLSLVVVFYFLLQEV